MADLTTAVIMAGGKGTRLASVTGVLPKPMAKVKNIEDTSHFFDADDTILAHQMDLLSQEGITDFILVVGSKKEFIQNAFTNEKINKLLPDRNITIRYFEEHEQNPLGTGGSFCSKDLQQMIGQNDFILTYADVLFDINIKDMFACHKQQKADATMLVGACKEPDDRVLCCLDKDGSKITRLIPKQGKGEAPRGCAFPNVARNGITIFSSRLFETLPNECTYMDMEADILTPMVYNPAYKVCAWKTPCYVKDIGTVDRYYEGVRDLSEGIPQSKNPAKTQQSCVIFREQDLIQNDGTINNDSAKAIVELNDKGVIVGLQCLAKNISQGTTIDDMALDTALNRQGNGAFVNFKFGEEDIVPIIQVMKKWNVSEQNIYVIENVLGVGYLVSSFSKGDQSFQLSPMSATFQILQTIENQKLQTEVLSQSSSMLSSIAQDMFATARHLDSSRPSDYMTYLDNSSQQDLGLLEEEPIDGPTMAEDYDIDLGEPYGEEIHVETNSVGEVNFDRPLSTQNVKLPQEQVEMPQDAPEQN